MQNASKAPPRREGVQAIARASAVLRALEPHPEGLGLLQLAGAVGLPKSTVHRLVGALAQEDLLTTKPGGRIALGGGLTRLGAAGSLALQDELRPLMARLREELGETVDLAVLDQGQMRFVEQLTAAHRLQAVSAVGARFPLHCTANGKALLAALSRERALALLPARLPRATEHTIVSRAALLEELEQIRARGVAFDREEHTVGISAVGAAVLGPLGPLAAISVPVPTARFRGSEQRYAAAVRDTAREAAALLGAAEAQPRLSAS
ncbi:MAG TPA: IclR family transcriptional regulator [Solirubrobacteraceae bacterium]|jgi:DNA-binding IclR family transcriptional regulator|nr:IclR family transcriptional regulator [Solirubrobacteraceae bacterium]